MHVSVTLKHKSSYNIDSNRFKSPYFINIQCLTMILTNATEHNDDRGRHFELSFVFAMSEVCLNSYESHV